MLRMTGSRYHLSPHRIAAIMKSMSSISLLNEPAKMMKVGWKQMIAIAAISGLPLSFTIRKTR